MALIDLLVETSLVNNLRLDRETIKAKADILAGYLAEWDPETIRRAFREHVKSSRFLPTVAELIEGCRAASAYRADNRNPKALPETVISLEDRQRNIERLRGLKERLSKKRGL